MKYLPYLLLFGSLSAAAGAPAVLVSNGPHPDAPEALMEYGQLVGNWQCKDHNLQQDGSWKESPGIATWSWYFMLDGHAVFDVWRPAPNAAGKVFSGTNLRTYDADTGIWNIVWTNTSSARIEAFQSSFRNDSIHITTERQASATFPKHMMHITFFNISEDHFDWKYESSPVTDGQNWREVSRLSCDRDHDEAEAVASQ